MYKSDINRILFDYIAKPPPSGRGFPVFGHALAKNSIGGNCLLWSFEIAKQSDISEILEIEKESFSHPWGELSFFEELVCKDAKSYVLKHEHLIGYIFFRLTFGEMHIFKIAVSGQWRGQGIASMILAKSLDMAIKEGAETAFLEVRPSNVSALALYRKFGFRVIAKRPGYYPETGEDGWILMKTLGES